MSETEKDLTDFARRFDGTQWRTFALTVLKMEDNKDLYPKWAALEKWCKGRINPVDELCKLRHKFFCDDEISDMGTIATDDIDEQNTSDSNIVTCQAAAGHVHSTTGPTKEIIVNDGHMKKRVEDLDEKNSSFAVAVSVNSKPNLKNDEEVYKSSGKRHVLIMNNSFDPSKTEKKGTRREQLCQRIPGCKEDTDRMRKLWVDILGCELFGEKVHEDITAVEMGKIIRSMGKNIQTKDCAFLVVIIMSHGGCDGYGEYLSGMGDDASDKLYLKDVWDPFLVARFENIPKLFIFHACRGNLLDSGVLVDTQLASKGLGEVPPPWSDFVVVYPSAPLHSAFETISTIKGEVGSWLISTIYNVFNEHYKTMHVCDMLTLVNAKMMRTSGTVKEEHGPTTTVKAMSEFVSFLRRDFYLV